MHATTTAPAPARLRAALLALGLGGFAIGTTEFVSMGLLPEISRGVGASIAEGGHLISAYALGVVVGAPVLAAFGSRVPRRTFLVGLMVAYCLGNVLSALAPTFGTLLAARFVAGLPHGAYFGVAVLVAADLAGAERRGTAVSRVLLGLTIANVVGVPAATALGQALGWRYAYVVAALLALATVVSVLRLVPYTPVHDTASVRGELAGLGRPQVWLTLAIGAVGGGGLFAIYSYVSPIMEDRAGLAVSLVPVALVVWGLGMVFGNVVGGRLTDWSTERTIALSFPIMVGAFLLFALGTLGSVTGVLVAFLPGLCLILPTALQTRLMDVSGEAQTMGAALNHAAFNAANALGAWLGGLAIESRYGEAGTVWVAIGLTLAGAAIFAVAEAVRRRAR
jgi:MFS transporter, DHA1 family, inner membrane transport protein